MLGGKLVGNLANCRRCGKLFVNVGKNICPTCVQDIEEEYTRCAEYLRENKLVNIYDLSDETEVPVKQISQFIREGRISIAGNPNLAYPCEACGTLIREGRLCNKCSERLNKGIKQVLEEKIAEEDVQKGGYYQLGNKKDKK